MRLGDRDDLAGAEWVPFENSTDWTLPAGNGERTVYAMFCSSLGQVSDVASDSIVLDTEPPSAGLSINNGANFTRALIVNVRLNASDNTGLPSMEISEDPSLANASPGPYMPDSYWTLSGPEGVHTLYARVWDLALNPSGIVSAAITLDLRPPDVHIDVPSAVDGYNISVDRKMSDQVSGVAYYEIEVRDGAGKWTQWLHVAAGNASAPLKYPGEDGHSYSFRMRAMDNAGNLGPFVEAANTSVVDIPAPEVTITEPLDGGTVKGVLRISGHAVTRNGPVLRQVLVRVDGGDWMVANGTYEWKFYLNTRDLKNGRHVVEARAYDGAKYSAEAAISVVVRNPVPERGLWTDNNIIWIILLVAAVACAATYAYYRASRGKRENDGTK
jgi:hypothetical protein